MEIKSIQLVVERQNFTVFQEKIRHREWGLMLVLGGKGAIHYRKGSLPFTSAGLMLLPGDCQYRFKPAEPLWFFIVNFTLSNGNEFWPEEPVFLSLGESDRVHAIFRELDQLWREKPFGYRLGGKSRLLELLYLWAQERNREGLRNRGYDGLHRVMNEIHHRFDSKLDMDELADLAGLSPSQFRRVFKANTGRSPLEYVNRLRMERAKNLLASQLFSLEEIALRCGLGNASRFCRRFRETQGMTPGEYRRRMA